MCTERAQPDESRAEITNSTILTMGSIKEPNDLGHLHFAMTDYRPGKKIPRRNVWCTFLFYPVASREATYKENEVRVGFELLHIRETTLGSVVSFTTFLRVWRSPCPLIDNTLHGFVPLLLFATILYSDRFITGWTFLGLRSQELPTRTSNIFRRSTH